LKDVNGVAGSWPVIAIYTATQILTNTASEDPGTHTHMATHRQLCLCAWFDGDSRPGQKPNQSQQQTNKYKHQGRPTHTDTHQYIESKKERERERGAMFI